MNHMISLARYLLCFTDLKTRPIVCTTNVGGLQRSKCPPNVVNYEIQPQLQQNWKLLVIDSYLQTKFHIPQTRPNNIHTTDCEIFTPTLNIIFSFCYTRFINDFFCFSLPHQILKTLIKQQLPPTVKQTSIKQVTFCLIVHIIVLYTIMYSFIIHITDITMPLTISRQFV